MTRSLNQQFREAVNRLQEVHREGVEIAADMESLHEDYYAAAVSLNLDPAGDTVRDSQLRDVIALDPAVLGRALNNIEVYLKRAYGLCCDLPGRDIRPADPDNENEHRYEVIQIGDRVRSFSFESHELTGPRASYVEGSVIDFKWMEGCQRYEIEVSRRVDCGEVVPLNELIDDAGMYRVYPPINGTPTTMDRICKGVVKINASNYGEGE